MDVQSPPATDGRPLNATAADGEGRPAPVEGPPPIALPAEKPARHWDRVATVRAALEPRLHAFAARTHTPTALRFGTAAIALLGVAAAVALVLVGFVGMGTHPQTFDDSSSALVGPQLPPEGAPSLFSPPSPLLPVPPPDAGLSQNFARVVLQPDDLAPDFTPLDRGSTGDDPTTGLVGSYHAVYQRPLSVAGTGSDQTIAVLATLSAYRTSQAASFHLNDVSTGTLAVDAGLPTLNSEPVTARTVGDESRAVHLTGSYAGVGIGVYLIQFRRGTTNAIVGVAAVLGSESLEQALTLAEKQDAHIIATALPPIS